MKINVMVAGVLHETWFRDTRDERQVAFLNCLDREGFLGCKLKQTFDYALSADEAAEIDVEKLDGACLSIAVEEVKAANGGRLRFRGKLDRASVPKDALIATLPEPAVKGANGGAKKG